MMSSRKAKIAKGTLPPEEERLLKIVTLIIIAGVVTLFIIQRIWLGVIVGVIGIALQKGWRYLRGAKV